MDAEEYMNLHERCKKLTGDAWCPYPSDLFTKVVMKVDDDTARQLIEERRKHSFPEFLMGEPMYDELKKYMEV